MASKEIVHFAWSSWGCQYFHYQSLESTEHVFLVEMCFPLNGDVSLISYFTGRSMARSLSSFIFVLILSIISAQVAEFLFLFASYHRWPCGKVEKGLGGQQVPASGNGGADDTWDDSTDVSGRCTGATSTRSAAMATNVATMAADGCGRRRKSKSKWFGPRWANESWEPRDASGETECESHAESHGCFKSDHEPATASDVVSGPWIPRGWRSRSRWKRGNARAVAAAVSDAADAAVSDAADAEHAATHDARTKCDTATWTKPTATANARAATASTTTTTTTATLPATATVPATATAAFSTTTAAVPATAAAISPAATTVPPTAVPATATLPATTTVPTTAVPAATVPPTAATALPTTVAKSTPSTSSSTATSSSASTNASGALTGKPKSLDWFGLHVAFLLPFGCLKARSEYPGRCILVASNY